MFFSSLLCQSKLKALPQDTYLNHRLLAEIGFSRLRAAGAGALLRVADIADLRLSIFIISYCVKKLPPRFHLHSARLRVGLLAQLLRRLLNEVNPFCANSGLCRRCLEVLERISPDELLSIFAQSTLFVVVVARIADCQ